ncbi:MAG: peptidase M14, partial [Pseudoxanthomonas sp.]
AQNGKQWLRLAQDADARAASLKGSAVPLAYAASKESRLVDFRGYQYTRTPSEVSGALMTRYDETRPQIWKIPLRDRLQPSLSIDAPGAGYIVPAAHASWVGAKLKAHGIDFRTLDARQGVAVQSFRASQATPAAQSSEGHQRMTVKGEWKPDKRDIGAGALFVPIAQPKSRLAMSILEPLAPDSLVGWGEFNNAFERKEYMEDYVAEEVAREMLQDPAVKARFEQRIRDDAAFAKDPQARLEFFHRLHASWDERYNLYPVMRVDRVPR